MKKVLLLGANSFTGSHIIDKLDKKYEIIPVSRDTTKYTYDVLIDDIGKIEKIVVFNSIDVIINCISDGNVDSCEENKEVANLINLQFVKDLVDLQNKIDFKILHFSTNAVYDGNNPFYNENSFHSPINYYGRIKSEADLYIEKCSKDYCILRPITMYGQKLEFQRDNPFSFFYKKLKENSKITAVNDIYVNMLFIDDLVSCVDKVMINNINGVFNISGSEVVNREDFIRKIKSHIDNSDSLIESVSSSHFDSLAPRPLNTSFDNFKMINELGVVPTTIDNAIKIMLEVN